MLTFCPTPFPDETLYSIAARWYALSGYSSTQRFLAAAFESPVNFDACDLGAHVVLESSAGRLLSGKAVSDCHTLLPFLGRFVDFEVVRSVANGGKLYSWRNYLPSDLHYCVSCVAEQQCRHGFAAWLRAHNLPGVSACHLHECRLHRVKKREGTLCLVPSESQERLEPAALVEIAFARETNALLQGDGTPRTFAELYTALREVARRRFAGKTRVERDHGAFRDALLGAYSEGFFFDCEITDSYDARRRLSLELRIPAKAIHPVTAILTANISYEGGILAVLRDALQLQSPPTRPAALFPKTKKEPRPKKKRKPIKLRKQKVLGPWQERWARDFKKAEAAAKLRVDLHRTRACLEAN